MTPHAIRLDPQGNVWATDAASSMVYKFSPEGKVLLQIEVGREWGSAGTGPGQFRLPHSIQKVEFLLDEMPHVFASRSGRRIGEGSPFATTQE